MNILVTGATGHLGSVLVPKLLAQGHTVYGLTHRPRAAGDPFIRLQGDILLADLGIEDAPDDIKAVYHLASLMNLGTDKDGIVWDTNVVGTINVIAFCAERQIPHLYFCSTAYTQGRNPYEVTKAVCERMVTHSDIPKVTIFKPSIILGPKDGHFSFIVSLLIKLLRRAGMIKLLAEGKLRLPVILEMAFRIPGDKDGFLNLVTVEAVAEAMANIKEEGRYFLTNPQPPLLADIAEWVGKMLVVNLRFEKDRFTPLPLEYAFQRMVRYFLPYFQGDDFAGVKTELDRNEITEAFIRDYILKLAH